MYEVSRDSADYGHEVAMAVRYDDLDTYRHVNNKKFLSFMEDARIDYLQSVGFEHHGLDEYGVVIARQTVDYWQAILFGDVVHVFTRCTRIGNKSMEFHHMLEVERGGERITAAGGVTVLVSIDPRSGETIANDSTVVERIRALEPELALP